MLQLSGGCGQIVKDKPEQWHDRQLLVVVQVWLGQHLYVSEFELAEAAFLYQQYQ